MRFQVSQGLKIKTPKGEIELEPGRLVDLPEAKATPLIQAGKIIFLPDPNLLCLFRQSFEKAVAAVGACYLSGTLEMIRADFPDLAGEIDQAEDRINIEWFKAREETGDLDIFKEAVERWRTLLERYGSFL